MIDTSLEHKRRGFMAHLYSFIPGVIAFILINYFTGPPWWAAWTVPGWAIGLLAHWWFVLGPGAPQAKADAKQSEA